MLDRTIAQLKSDEGFRSTVYKDTRNVNTFGYGFTWISEPEANKILQDRVIDIASQLYNQLPFYRELDEVRSSALLNMAYNVGIHGLLEFRIMLDCLEKKDWKEAANAMRNSLWHKETGNRAERLSLMVETGKWLQ